MSDKNNIYSITGVIFAKPVRYAPDKKGKNGGQPYEFPSIILEVKRQHREKEFVELPELELGKGVSLDGFDVGDRVEISFSLSGREVSWMGGDGEKKTMHKTTAKALYIKHLDVQYNDTRDVGAVYKPRVVSEDTTFVPPNPLDDDNEDFKDLPF